MIYEMTIILFIIKVNNNDFIQYRFEFSINQTKK